ncbi:MAG: hypothetical protein V3V62_00260, partial [bacterium]
VPYIFAYSPALLAVGSWREVLLASGTAILGVLFFSAAVQGYLIFAAGPAARLLYGAAAFGLLMPGLWTDAAGAALASAAWLLPAKGDPSGRGAGPGVERPGEAGARAPG